MSDEHQSEAAVLSRYLAAGFAALRWKLDGLSEYDLRRPLVASGTNLLGLAKHVALVSGEYFGFVFERPSAVPPVPEDGEPNADMWATAAESAGTVLGWLDTAAAEAAATLAQLSLDAEGFVPWWGGERPNVTLRMVTIHMVAELHRHAGHADLARELIDEQVGWSPTSPNLPGEGDGADAEWWVAYRQTLESTAEAFR